VFIGFAQPVGAAHRRRIARPRRRGLAFFATLQYRRQAQETLRESALRAEAKFQALAENAQDAIVSADSLGDIIYFNKAAQHVFGYEASEVVGKPLTLLMPERIRNRHREGIERLLAAGESYAGRKIDVVGKKRTGVNFRRNSHLEAG
jgi:PAS domain S-box-containing protein